MPTVKASASAAREQTHRQMEPRTLPLPLTQQVINATVHQLMFVAMNVCVSFIRILEIN